MIGLLTWPVLLGLALGFRTSNGRARARPPARPRRRPAPLRPARADEGPDHDLIDATEEEAAAESPLDTSALEDLADLESLAELRDSGREVPDGRRAAKPSKPAKKGTTNGRARAPSDDGAAKAAAAAARAAAEAAAAEEAARAKSKPKRPRGTVTPGTPTRVPERAEPMPEDEPEETFLTPFEPEPEPEPEPEYPEGYDPDAAARRAQEVANHVRNKQYDYSHRLVEAWQIAAGARADGVYGWETMHALEYFGAERVPRALFRKRHDGTIIQEDDPDAQYTPLG